jgi:pyrroline-5-carboxylate reductase
MLKSMKIGFIGAGMMAEAIAHGLLRAGVRPDMIMVADPSEDRRNHFEKMGVAVAQQNSAAASFADTIILAVKPDIVMPALSEIASFVTPEKLIISIAAGVTTESINSRLQGEIPVVRVMPNTPCLVSEGASAVAPGMFASGLHTEIAAAIFGSVGRVVQVQESKLNAVTGLSGSAPAFVYMFIEALADGGVRMGLPKSTAMVLAAQTVAGAARMVLETSIHPAELRDKVMTPGGTTVAGVAELERAGFRSASIEAVTAAAKRSAELGAASKK